MQPKVMLIFMDCCEEKLKQKINRENYENLEAESVCLEKEGIKKALQIILNTDCPYISFCENDIISEPDKISRMVEYLEKNREYDGVFCLGRHVDEKGSIAQHIQDGWLPDITYNVMGHGLSDAFLLFDFALHWEENILGSLENCMIRRDAYLNKEFCLAGLK